MFPLLNFAWSKGRIYLLTKLPDVRKGYVIGVTWLPNIIRSFSHLKAEALNGLATAITLKRLALIAVTPTQ